MADRKPVKQETLDPAPSEILAAKEILRPFYEQYPERLGDKSIDEKIEEVIEKAKIGYPYCPKNFIARVRRMLRVPSGEKTNLSAENVGGNYFANRENIVNKVLSEREKELQPGIFAKEIRNSLPPSERKFWIERELQYRKEFKFNDSSDWPLLQQVLTEEIIQHRLVTERLKDPEAKNDRELNGSYDRMSQALEALGITREQRQAANSEMEGNISQIAKNLDKKLRNIEAIEAKDEQEERILQATRKDPSVLNSVPEDLRPAVEKAWDSEDY